MKLSLGDRILAGMYVLLTLVLAVAAGLRAISIDLMGDLLSRLTALTEYWYLIFFGLLLIILLLGAYMLRLVFRRKPKGSAFVTVDAGENGKVIVAMSALEQMVRQAARNAQGVADMKIGVTGGDDSISVAVELTVLGGVHLPTVTMNLQREIRNYVELNSGVAVRDVTVTVGAVISPEEAAQAASGKKRARKAALQPPVVYQPEPVVPEQELPVEEAAEPAAESETVVESEPVAEAEEYAAAEEEAEVQEKTESVCEEEIVKEVECVEPETPAEAAAPEDDIYVEKEQNAENA